MDIRHFGEAEEEEDRSIGSLKLDVSEQERRRMTRLPGLRQWSGDREVTEMKEQQAGKCRRNGLFCYTLSDF